MASTNDVCGGLLLGRRDRHHLLHRYDGISFVEAFYWAVETTTTVGYGDVNYDGGARGWAPRIDLNLFDGNVKPIGDGCPSTSEQLSEHFRNSKAERFLIA